MARWLRLAAVGATALVLLAVVGIWGTYRAVRHVRPFYREAIAIDGDSLETGSQQLESQVGALYSDTQQAGQWHAAFTADQINGWLATELDGDYADLLPEGVSDPRIAITSDQLSLGFRTRQHGLETVITVEAELLVTEINILAVRITAVKAGALPLPTGQIANELSEVTKSLSQPIHWTQLEGDPVALVQIQPSDRQLYLESIELLDGEIYVAGRTELTKAEPIVEATDEAAPAEDAPAEAAPVVANSQVEHQSSRQ